MSDVEKWGDAQQYRAEPHSSYAGPQSGVMPQVKLLWMTPDPLGAVAAMAAMYEGRVVRSLDELSHEDRVHYWHEMRKTKLNTPFETVVMHFLLEGVDRSFTHQAVRKRTGTAFAQESLRFAVPGELRKAASLPPSLQGTDEVVDSDSPLSEQQAWRMRWDEALGEVDRAYHRLVSSGMPAEEARGLLPHATATRMHYVVNLRSLLEEAGNRLCTQAQFHWRMVMGQIVFAVRQYYLALDPPNRMLSERVQVEKERKVEFGLIADAFRPVCYQEGRCPFGAQFDRACSIRERVRWFGKRGVPSEDWDREHVFHQRTSEEPAPWGKIREKDGKPYMVPGESVVPAIRPEEWLLNPGAARKT